MKWRDIFSWNGELDRLPYLWWGLILFGVKYNLDRLVNLWGFGREWFITDYFLRTDHVLLQSFTRQDFYYYGTLAAISLPFIYLGTILCVKRLRSIGTSPWWVLAFFLPLLNFLLFLVLTILPARSVQHENERSFWQKLLPENRIGSAAFSVTLVVLIALLLTWFSVNALETYGWGIFIGVPFFTGFGSVLIYTAHQQVPLREALSVAFFSVLIFGAFILVTAIEGLLCVIMAFPIATVLSLIGGLLAHWVRDYSGRSTASVFSGVLLMLPLTMYLEQQSEVTPPLVAVRTEVTVAAPPETVWPHLVAFSEIPAPTEWLFHTGIAYPVKAEIEGTGVGAVRYCNFTTGPFVEPITHWEAPHLLKFDVREQPQPMEEWSLYENLHMPHLYGYFSSHRGQFKLTATAEGSTVLEGTTWYTHNIWPNFYWKAWSDYILHQIHLRVLNHIKAEVEKEPLKACVD